MRKSSLYIKDIIDAITKIEEFIEGMSYQEFVNGDKTSSAVIRKIEIIGDLPPLKARLEEIYLILKGEER